MTDTVVPIVHDTHAFQRRFVVVGTRTKATAKFHLHALGDSGGRMDIFVRCMRAALLVSDGVRRDTLLDLLMLAGEDAPLALRLNGSTIRFLRPDERRNAILLQGALSARHPGTGPEHLAPGFEALPVDLETLLSVGSSLFFLDPDGEDVRSTTFGPAGATFVVGDDRGFTPEQRETLGRLHARPLRLGPTDVHTEDAISLVHNELDRRL
jgi:tRNA (pseudouridine54-N1)-methyltransferase